MLWIATSLFLLGLAVRELLIPWRRMDRPDTIYLPYVLLLVALSAAFAWPVLRRWRLESFLASRASVLADGRPASVHCNTMFDTMLDPSSLYAGHADPDTGEIVLQSRSCDALRDYIDDPAQAGLREIGLGLNVFTHESMHVRGELNEAATECQSVQFNYRSAKLLGVPDALAKRHAAFYYTDGYALRANNGGFGSEYYSLECKPGGALDLHLPDSSWAALEPDVGAAGPSVDPSRE